eukprot:TRINITY_DN9778_c0_g1_i8.p1 TRINITY_DN9778_c0_g1~~TRINITY_DN9778_c0_g1_i8.p1  ORF type:complete len:582 (-),score=67.91 TRINITY_DN9778_c0_g1_i8:226-1971(-)
MSSRKVGVHHLSQASSSKDGWVEGITDLKEDSPATQLLNDIANIDLKKTTTENSTSVKEGMTEQQIFEATLEHALGTMVAQCNDQGEVQLKVGVPLGWGPCCTDEEGLENVLTRIEKSANVNKADSVVYRKSMVQGNDGQGQQQSFYGADVIVRRRAGIAQPLEIRVAIIGNVDSGKSTMVGVLTRSILDDGRGFARSKVFKHNHETQTGRTSSIGQHNLCLDSKGTIVNDEMFKTNNCGEYVAKASKVITLVDLAGHEKYFKTTAYGLTGHLPDYACLIVGANAGIVGMCKEHLGVALALKVPVFFVVTKVDLAPEHVLKNTLMTLNNILRKPGVKKKPFLVRTLDDVFTCACNMSTESLAPIFLTSSVTGRGLDLVRRFYSILPQRQQWAEKAKMHAEFVIDETFGVPGVGTVVAGTMKGGCISTNATLLIGPDLTDGLFKPVSIKSIHYKRLPVHSVVAGQTASFALKKIKKQQVRKGMVLVDESIHPKAHWEFDADIAILTHSTTIQPRYQAVIHCEIIRQSARVIAMDKERLRSGDRACVRFRFMQRPEYICIGNRFVFREGRTKGIGKVIGVGED